MKLVLLSGGAGKRLWPMSNDSRSKQFLKVLRDADGRPVSMLQRVWSQLDEAGLKENAYICASRAQHEMIEHQLGNVSIIEEPDRRDTFPAIALASMYLRDVEFCADNEVIVVMPVDPFVDQSFFTTLQQLPKALVAAKADLVLMGVTPTEPTSKFGYIRTVPSLGNPSVDGKVYWHDVNAFVEKPKSSLAEQLIAEGALWNCGVFAFSVGYLRRELRRLGYPASFHELQSAFHDLPKRSFDYEIVENAKRIAAISYQGMWSDLGSWGALSEQMTESFVGRGSAMSCKNTHVVNELGIPLVAMGLEDVMVVSTPDGILVADKSHAANVKEAIKGFGGRPMCEERRWGSSRVLDYQKLDDGSEVLTKCIDILPGRHITYQRHSKRTEVWTVVEGRGQLVLGTNVVEVSAGDVVKIYPNQWHAIFALSGLQVIEVQRGEELVEEDIERRFKGWEEVLDHCARVPV
ncbi:sugar phosphate nucleotidyltransferase [Alicyclobacillus ferrooxydans]|uniref:Mannose-1-phosphate guanylyltransferase n=1 Tax=Alicyclobacillus ferrooxydans TaxID=471514 RepID=A0A0N8PMP9_9BACL|nr:sugar phosphate nucleotidyltransferase [Alicyclobacillus ferrooxydans]KPV39333.1 mannose-1-phosphate guanylyltransferase [Alicyclobacillus ferrooxydans]